MTASGAALAFARRHLPATIAVGLLALGGAAACDTLDRITGQEGAAVALEQRWGVEIESLRASAGGYMLDFRYRVRDTAKAAPLFRRQTKPVLIHQATGTKLGVPSPAKTGPLRSSNPPIADRTYFMFFANPGRFIKHGDKVTVVIGDFRAEDLTVQ